MSEIKRETPEGLVVQILADPVNRVPILVHSCIVAEAAAKRARDLAEHYRTVTDLQARELSRLQGIIDKAQGEDRGGRSVEWMEEACRTINAGVALMDRDTLRRWEGVRAVLEACPLGEEREDISKEKPF